MSRDSRTPLKLMPRWRPGGVEKCPAVLAPNSPCGYRAFRRVGVEEAVSWDLKKNLGSDPAASEGGIRKPELEVCSEGIVCILYSLMGRTQVQEEKQSVGMRSHNSPSFGQVGCLGQCLRAMRAGAPGASLCLVWGICGSPVGRSRSA